MLTNYKEEPKLKIQERTLGFRCSAWLIPHTEMPL